MSLRKQIKKIFYGKIPFFSGKFPYYGVTVYFPKNSIMFESACNQGVFESENVKLIVKLVQPDSVYLDIGANIGLMSIPILNKCTSCTVIAFEPSPNTNAFLNKTLKNSGYQERWHVIDKAVGNNDDFVDFVIADSNLGAHDGFKDTKRAGKTKKVKVNVTSIDKEWNNLNNPFVSVIKIDVEGAELQVLDGGMQCIRKNKPYILLEWNPINLKAYDCKPESLLIWCKESGYQIFSLPHLIPIDNKIKLNLHMLKTESFLLISKDK